MSSHTLSPIKPNGELTQTAKFTLQDGTEVKMVVDIDLNGNTGEPKFYHKNRILQKNPRNRQNLKIMNTIQEDANGIVKSNYDYVINNTKEKIQENGGNVSLFEERLNDNNNSNVDGAVENAFKRDYNDDGFVGNTEETTNTNPQEFKSPQVKKEDLVYPTDMLRGDNTESQDYVFIEQFAYLPPQPLMGDRLTERGMKFNDENPVKINTLPDVIGFGVRRSNNISNNIKERFGSCTLPIPNKLGVSNGVNWGEARANAIELAGFQSAGSAIRNNLQNFDPFKLIGGGLNTANETFKTLRDKIQDPVEGEPDAGNILSATLAKAVLSQLNINVDIDQFITRQTGAAINPNLELLFGGPQLRTFSFVFDFAPNSSSEAEVVRKIQRWFKQGMLPSRSGVSGTRASSLFLGSPNVFRIAYMNKSRRIKGLNIIKICALTSCQIDFTPDNTYQSYEDTNAFSQPVRSTMALTFNELTPIFRDDYGDDENSGFARDPSLEDLDTNITGDNSISDTDIGF